MTNASLKEWFTSNWSRAGLVTAIILLLLSPLFFMHLGVAFWVFFQLPIYMLHQYEEHSDGQFKLYINDMFGKPVLTDDRILFINVVYVWLLFIACLYLATFVHLGFGLIPVYLTGLNAVTHIAMAIKKREYNPGLITSSIFCLPAAILSMIIIQAHNPLPIWQHVAAFAVVIAIHAEMIIRIKLEARK